MKNTYLVWENPACKSINPIWRELNGQEFLALVRSTEVAGRYFVKLGNAQDGTAIVIEATRASYLAWKKEKNHSEYLKSCAESTSTFSYHEGDSAEGGCGEELMEDITADVLSECFAAMTRETLKAALVSLTEDEYKLIAYLYLSDKRGTESRYAALCGVSQKAINKRKIRVLAKLKTFFEKQGT